MVTQRMITAHVSVVIFVMTRVPGRFSRVKFKTGDAGVILVTAVIYLVACC